MIYVNNIYIYALPKIKMCPLKGDHFKGTLHLPSIFRGYVGVQGGYIYIYRSLSEHMFEGNISCQQKRHDKMTMVALFQCPMIFSP